MMIVESIALIVEMTNYCFMANKYMRARLNSLFLQKMNLNS